MVFVVDCLSMKRRLDPGTDHFFQLHLDNDLDTPGCMARRTSDSRFISSNYLLWQHEFGAGSLCTAYSLATGQADPFAETAYLLEKWMEDMGNLPWYTAYVAARAEEGATAQKPQDNPAWLEKKGESNQKDGGTRGLGKETRSGIVRCAEVQSSERQFRVRRAHG